MGCSSKKAFSLIELVFIIIITGILAATALPRFVGISDDARVTKIEAFVGTLNRSVGPMLWSNVLRKEPQTNGKLSTSSSHNTLTEDVEVDSIPIEFINLGNPRQFDLTKCLDAATHSVPDIGSPVGNLTDGKIASTATIGTTTYALGCIDGDISISPRFYLYDEGEGIIIY